MLQKIINYEIINVAVNTKKSKIFSLTLSCTIKFKRENCIGVTYCSNAHKIMRKILNINVFSLCNKGLKNTSIQKKII